MTDTAVPGSRPLVDGLHATEVRIGETLFTFAKPLVLDGWGTIELLREGLSHAADLPLDVLLDFDDGETMTVGDQVKFTTLMVGVLSKLPRRLVVELQQRLFDNVQFVSTKAGSVRKLLGNEGLAFEGLEPGHVYEVMVRSLAVGFTASLPVLASLFGRAQASMTRLNTPTSPASSPPQSSPDASDEQT